MKLVPPLVSPAPFWPNEVAHPPSRPPLLPATTPSRLLHAAPYNRPRAGSCDALADAEVPAKCGGLVAAAPITSELSNIEALPMFLVLVTARRIRWHSIVNRREPCLLLLLLPFSHRTVTLYGEPPRLPPRNPTSRPQIRFFGSQLCCVVHHIVYVLRVSHKQSHPSARRASRSGLMGVFCVCP